MGNNYCLVTRLKGTVSSVLPEYGCMIVHFDGSSIMQMINVYNQNAYKCKIVDSDVRFVTTEGADTGLQEITVPANSTVWSAGYALPPSAVCDVSFGNKYTITNIGIGANSLTAHLNTEELRYLNKINTLEIGGRDFLIGDIGNIGENELKRLAINRNIQLFGNIEDLKPTGLEEIMMAGLKNVTGEIKFFSKYPNLRTLWIDDTGIGGTVESLVAAYSAAGRSSGTLSLALKGCNVTYQNKKVTSGGTDLVWENGSIVSFPVNF